MLIDSSKGALFDAFLKLLDDFFVAGAAVVVAVVPNNDVVPTAGCPFGRGLRKPSPAMGGRGRGRFPLTRRRRCCVVEHHCRRTRNC